MTFYILDPGLVHGRGHHLGWDLMIGEILANRGQEVAIVAQKDFVGPYRQNGIDIVPYFSHSPYERASQDAVISQYDDFCYFNDTLATELRDLPYSFGIEDTVLIPTVTQNHILGFVSWMKSFDLTLAPLFVVHLIFPPGVLPREDGSVVIYDPQLALFYKLALRAAFKSGTPVYMFGGGAQIARSFSALTSHTIVPLACPSCPTRRIRPPRDKRRQRVLLYVGDAKLDKGMALLPGLARNLCRENLQIDFIVHADTDYGSAEALKIRDELLGLAASYGNFIFHPRHLAREEYFDMLEAADCIVITYDPNAYFLKSSGIVWEAIALGIPLLFPSDCWVSREIQIWDAGGLSYKTHNLMSICDSFSKFISHLPEMRTKAAKAATRFQATNGADKLVTQIDQLWIRRTTATTLRDVCSIFEIPVEELRDGWHDIEIRDGRPARWTKDVANISFWWTFCQPWELEITVEQFTGPEQLRSITATVDDNRPLPVRAETDRGRLLVIGLSGSRSFPQVTVRLNLPWTHRAAGGTKDLGMLVSKLRIWPSEANRETNQEWLDQTECLSPVEMRERVFTLADVASGRTAVNPFQPAEIRFKVRHAPVEAIRKVRLYVNGIELRIRISAIEGGEWSAQASCSRENLLLGGYQLEWDLVANIGPHVLLVEDFTVVNVSPVL